MTDQSKVKLPSSGQIQLGLVVNDLGKCMEYYSSIFGIGPWRILEVDSPELMVRGEKHRWQARVAFAELDGAQNELIEPVGGKSIHFEYLNQGREGLHHIGFFVTDEEKDQIQAELGKQNIGIIQGGNSSTGQGSHAYLDTDKIGGVMFELIHKPTS
jgi:hypothetical protein